MYRTLHSSIDEAFALESVFYDRIKADPRYDQGTQQFVKNRNAHVASTSI